jgi:UDP-glucose 4-epimerase
MRVVIVGATGNVGTSLVRLLADDPAVTSVLGLARRAPSVSMPKVTWQAIDIRRDDLVAAFTGADVVVHLAWAVQPSHDEPAMVMTNVFGSGRVFDAATTANVSALVYGSSVGAYAAGPKDRRVDESWPATGIASSFYARHKATVERMLDRVERQHPSVRVVRMRPGLIFKRTQGSEARRFFLGPLLPASSVRPSLLPVLPDVEGLVFQAVHTADVAEAYRLAIVGEARGAFNLVAEPVLDMSTVARALGARTVPVPVSVLRFAMEASWRARLQPTPTGWLDMGLSVPVLSSNRARTELGWQPRTSSLEAVREVLEGIAAGEGEPTARLAPGGAGPFRAREFATGIGTTDDA